MDLITIALAKKMIGGAQAALDNKADAIINTASGSVVTFTDGADNVPVKSLVVTIAPVQEGSGDPSPENIRPFDGFTSIELSYSGADTSDPDTQEISFPSDAGTVYGCTVNATDGTLTVTWGEIDSYNGETLPGEWKSDRDVYSAGETPTTGAQVVYELAEAVVYRFAPVTIATRLGDNNIWADFGTVSVDYAADVELYIEAKIAEATAQSALSVSPLMGARPNAQPQTDEPEVTEDEEQPEEEAEEESPAEDVPQEDDVR